MTEGPESTKKIKASFQIINKSKVPILVSSAQASCGCTELDWEGGILKADEK